MRLKRIALLGAPLVALLLGSALSDEKPRDDGRPPNVIIIFTDDQGYQDVGVFGAPKIKTPNLDRMAAEGKTFTSFYSAAPVCSPSRAALLTGSYPPRVGITGVLFPRHRIGLSSAEVTIADALGAQGYATACIGKWHLGHLPQFLPLQHGFDSYFGIPYSNDMDGVKGKNRGLDRTWKDNDWSPWNVPLMRGPLVIERPARQDSLTRRYTEEAIAFIRAHRDEPFFLYLPHTMPHIPLFVDAAFRGRSEGGPYGDTIEEIDWSVGRLLATLSELDIDEETLVIFTSDNGPWLQKLPYAGSALPLRGGKFSVWEGGMRVPCIMRWPTRIPAGTRTDRIAASIDLLPTIARLAGARLPQDRQIDGVDIWPLMAARDAAAPSPRSSYAFYKGAALHAIRSGRWKLHVARPRGRKGGFTAPELYDLEADISESTNLATEHPAVVWNLTSEAARLHSELSATSRSAGSAD